MDDIAFTNELRRYGPSGPLTKPSGLREARIYCRRLARRHYENFTVASWLLPRHLRQHICNIYAFCRWADDLGDEVDDAAVSLQLLDWWRQQLDACYRGQASHPVFVALADTVGRFDIPQQPFCDLITAFARDQRQSRYETIDDLLDYCRLSADPVGRLVLHLVGSHTEDCVERSDRICTGLQLANFCQDVAGDWDRGRVYLPQETCRAFGYDEAAFRARLANDAFRQVMETEVNRAASYLRAGWPLVERAPHVLRHQVELFVRGGLAILEQIRRQDYDVWRRRPTVGKWRKLRLALAAYLGRRSRSQR